jgi:hypothetical protein
VSKAEFPAASETRRVLLRQYDVAWQLARYHLADLSTAECLWRPASRGLHVHREPDGRWRADWPEHEAYDLGPPSIAWLTWHVGFWWSMVFDHSFGAATLTRDQVHWPGDADGVRAWIDGLEERWRRSIEHLSDDELQGRERTRWPFHDRPFADVLAWLNVELTKNAAEVGYARFLYAVRAK